ncbi:uncharacterized protein [Drosophila bipectinata]|uniref:uncharacterized protein n=1 Tax=Drosophila bipectinata TaxID=42026 RepID=UPI0038B325CE
MPLTPIDEMGAILEDLLAKVNDQKVRSINQVMKNSFARLKELQELLRDQNFSLPSQEGRARCGCSGEAPGCSSTRVEEATQTSPERASFSQVARTKRPRELPPPNRANQNGKKDPKISQPKKSRPDVLIITGNAGSSYSDVLKLVTRRQDGKLNDVSQNVKKIRRTAKGDLLLELAAKDANALKMRQTLSQVLGEAASVRAVSGETTIEIRDLDDLTTKDEIVAAIKARTSGQEEAIRVKSLRPGFSGTQVAFLGVEPSLASKILSEGRIRIGWTMCRVRERSAQRRCFRCLSFGHIAAYCKERTDRSNWCLRCAHSLLEQVLREKRADIALISEPYKKVETQSYILDSSKTAAIWAPGRQPESIQPRVGFVRAKVGAFWLYSCYLPPRLTLQQFTHTIDEIAQDARHRSQVVIAGDFNAWVEDWGSSRTNARGRTLQETFATLDVALLNTGSQNTFSKAGYGSIVDLTFCSSGLFRRTTWSLRDDYTASDHKYIVCDIEDREQASTAAKPPRFNPATLQPLKFAQELRIPDPSGDVECDVHNTMAAVLQACRASMRSSRGHSRHHEPVPWWPPEIAHARRECLRTRRLHQRARGRPDFEQKREDFAAKR